jgi:predicted  nucleic acid-binding Zn-ribbon protein
MATKKDETASFVLRFTQKIFQGDDGESQIQWRGHIRHVQSDEEKRFSEFEDVSKFIQTKLADLTIQAMEDKSPEEQKGILSKSFDLWKKMAFDAPRMVIDTLKDPKKQLGQVQEQINQVQDAISHKVEETIGNRLDIDEWRAASKNDYNNLMEAMEKVTKSIEVLNKKVDALSKKK